MKRILFLFSVLVFFSANQLTAQETPDTLKAEITFTEVVHDFGEIFQGDKAEWNFEFKNTGKAPLILSAVSPSCGCTVASFPREPIGLNQQDTISVKYNSNNPGSFTKTITVVSNAMNSPLKLTIKGIVNVKK